MTIARMTPFIFCAIATGCSQPPKLPARPADLAGRVVNMSPGVDPGVGGRLVINVPSTANPLGVNHAERVGDHVVVVPVDAVVFEETGDTTLNRIAFPSGWIGEDVRIWFNRSPRVIRGVAIPDLPDTLVLERRKGAGSPDPGTGARPNDR